MHNCTRLLQELIAIKPLLNSILALDIELFAVFLLIYQKEKRWLQAQSQAQQVMYSLPCNMNTQQFPVST